MMARTKLYPVVLSDADRQWLMTRVRAGSYPAQQVRRARILLELDENNPDRVAPVPTQKAIAARAGVSVDTLARRLEILYTPKHGSWLNTAEIELSALTRQRLDRRIDDLEVQNTELAAWQHATNTDQRQVNSHFTTKDARTRLRHLYPER